jgi:hypothetical protein
MMNALTAAVDRDTWSWIQIGFALLAGITGFIVFVPWALERRRRPEARFMWKISPNEDPSELSIWLPEYVPEISRNRPVVIEAAVQNVGDRPADDGLMNFVVPNCFELCIRNESPTRAIAAIHITAGLPPEHRILYRDQQMGSWAPGIWTARQYLVKYTATDAATEPLRVRLLFTVAADRFNAAGFRWLPSIVRPIEPVFASAGTQWPPRADGRIWVRLFKGRIRWIRVMPRGRIACSPGNREDVRDLIVLPLSEAAA